MVHVNIFNTFDHVLDNVYSSYLVSELPNIYFTWICTPHRLTLTLIKLCQSTHKYLQTGCRYNIMKSSMDAVYPWCLLMQINDIGPTYSRWLSPNEYSRYSSFMMLCQQLAQHWPIISLCITNFQYSMWDRRRRNKGT